MAYSLVYSVGSMHWQLHASEYIPFWFVSLSPKISIILVIFRRVWPSISRKGLDIKRLCFSRNILVWSFHIMWLSIKFHMIHPAYGRSRALLRGAAEERCWGALLRSSAYRTVPWSFSQRAVILKFLWFINQEIDFLKLSSYAYRTVSLVLSCLAVWHCIKMPTIHIPQGRFKDTMRSYAYRSMHC